jgi:hypothetical protein
LSARNDRKIWIFSNNNITGLTVGDTIGSSVGTNISLGEIRFNSNGFIYHSSTSGASSDAGGIIIKSNNTLNPTVNNPKDLAVGSTFAPTSGTGTYVAEMINPVINQTGGANGITRGLYVNPTLTAAADWRSIEWSNNSGWGLYGAGTAPNYLGGNTTIKGTVTNSTSILQVQNLSGLTALNVRGDRAVVVEQLQVSDGTNKGFTASYAGAGGYQFALLVNDSGVSFSNGAGASRPVSFNMNTGEILRIDQNFTSIVTNNFLVGTTTNAGFKLDVNGTARVSDNLTVSRNHNAATSLIISNTTSGANAGAGIGFDNNVGVGAASINKGSSGSGSYKILSGADFSLLNGGAATNGDIGILNDRTAGIIKFASGGASTPQLTLTAVGRLLLGTTTEGTFLLDVNGSARFSGSSTITRISSTESTQLNIINTGSGTNAGSQLRCDANNSAGFSTLGKFSTGNTTVKIITAENAYWYNTSAGDMAILNDFASGTIKMAAGGSSTAHMTIKSNGRINMSSLPTSATGLSAGDIWNDGGTLKIV